MDGKVNVQPCCALKPFKHQLGFVRVQVKVASDSLRGLTVQLIFGFTFVYGKICSTLIFGYSLRINWLV